jgi:hypothetical protein
VEVFEDQSAEKLIPVGTETRMLEARTKEREHPSIQTQPYQLPRDRNIVCTFRIQVDHIKWDKEGIGG